MTSVMSNESDSRLYGRFRHVPREQLGYRHTPFDWYRPPQLRYDIVHEDAAVMTLDGPVPMEDYYRYRLYENDLDEYDDYDDDETISYESDVEDN